MKKMNDVIVRVTENIRERSLKSRAEYLLSINHMNSSEDTNRGRVGCSNLAHAAASAEIDKINILKGKIPNIGIVSAYNDMLSAHKPFEKFPEEIKEIARSLGATAQMAGCVPAMCDGITQGRPGMELSLMSRDVIAMATAVSLSHNVYDGVIALGICDKIVPGMVIGALSHGHLPLIFAPAGPMGTGISNSQKVNVRKEFAQGKVGRDRLLEIESQAYHGKGTCTFYGTANSNQMLMEIMGLQIPNSSFVHPDSAERKVFIKETVKQILAINRKTVNTRSIGQVLDERSFVNAIVGLHATGGSTNHLLHLPAMASAAGIKLLWEDFEEVSKVVPLIARIYPNGQADVNEFHKAGGMSFVLQELMDEGFLDPRAQTSWGNELADSYNTPIIDNSDINFSSVKLDSRDQDILRPVSRPFNKNGGIKVLTGNLGKAVIKVSAVAEKHHKVSAQALVFNTQMEVKDAFDAGLLDRDVVVVVRGQGPKANGMPELHSLTPMLSVIQDKGFQVALVTDGRMSGASGKIPAAIHLYPEAVDGGALSKVSSGDYITIDAVAGTISADLDVVSCSTIRPSEDKQPMGFGRQLFSVLRTNSANAEMGGGINILAQSHTG
tara:strand:+ start:193 stop:2022 length:1830 start_codon:yes stop_codon:yes gene_type:complete